MTGKAIKDEMEKQGITGKVMAKKAGMHEGGLSLILNDKGNPTVETIQRIVDVLNVPIVIAPTNGKGGK